MPKQVLIFPNIKETLKNCQIIIKLSKVINFSHIWSHWLHKKSQNGVSKCFCRRCRRNRKFRKLFRMPLQRVRTQDILHFVPRFHHLCWTFTSVQHCLVWALQCWSVVSDSNEPTSNPLLSAQYYWMFLQQASVCCNYNLRALFWIK